MARNPLPSLMRACALLLALALACTASAAGPAPGTGLIFGSFDVSDSDVGVTHAVLMRIKPTKMYMGASGERETVTFEDGRFYSADLAPGTYALNGFFSGNQFFALERSLRNNTVQVEAGRAAYIGSYKLNVEKGGLLRKFKGTFEPIGTPATEAALRVSLAQELAGSGWTEAVRGSGTR